MADQGGTDGRCERGDVEAVKAAVPDELDTEGISGHHACWGARKSKQSEKKIALRR